MTVCPSCGNENPAGARFCNHCSTPLEPAVAPAREERKVVTVLFADLVGFTARAEQMDPEDVVGLLGPYHARLHRPWPFETVSVVVSEMLSTSATETPGIDIQQRHAIHRVHPLHFALEQSSLDGELLHEVADLEEIVGHGLQAVPAAMSSARMQRTLWPALIKRMALIIDDARITHVFYPVFPPDRNAADVLAWLKANPV